MSELDERAEFDRSAWYVEGASPEITAEESRRNEVCESYIRSANWAPTTPKLVRSVVAMNVRGAWPVAYTQGWKDAVAAERTWDGLMRHIDAIYPADVFDGSSRDPGPRLIVALREIDRLLAALKDEREWRARLRSLVNAQADDEGLWFIAATAPEAYLQQELRRLHTEVEAALADLEGGE